MGFQQSSLHAIDVITRVYHASYASYETRSSFREASTCVRARSSSTEPASTPATEVQDLIDLELINCIEDMRTIPDCEIDSLPMLFSRVACKSISSPPASTRQSVETFSDSISESLDNHGPEHPAVLQMFREPVSKEDAQNQCISSLKAELEMAHMDIKELTDEIEGLRVSDKEKDRYIVELLMQQNGISKQKDLRMLRLQKELSDKTEMLRIMNANNERREALCMYDKTQMEIKDEHDERRNRFEQRQISAKATPLLDFARFVNEREERLEQQRLAREAASSFPYPFAPSQKSLSDRTHIYLQLDIPSLPLAEDGYYDCMAR